MAQPSTACKHRLQAALEVVRVDLQTCEARVGAALEDIQANQHVGVRAQDQLQSGQGPHTQDDPPHVITAASDAVAHDQCLQRCLHVSARHTGRQDCLQRCSRLLLCKAPLRRSQRPSGRTLALGRHRLRAIWLAVASRAAGGLALAARVLEQALQSGVVARPLAVLRLSRVTPASLAGERAGGVEVPGGAPPLHSAAVPGVEILLIHGGHVDNVVAPAHGELH
mmetsp:Transcript_34410/g.93207  ORF Transcript_34410/g.93207 Transcript_34410/m.93207 type:complete len:224 (+) Transcript_34410:153-824(+)